MANLLIVDFGEHSSGVVLHNQAENSDVDTNIDTLYIGGYPAELRTKKSYLENARNYNGCIKSLKQTTKSNDGESTIIDLNNTIKFGDFGQETGCPTT